MSENLDLVRSIYADWERGDFSNVGWADPDIEYSIAEGPASGTGRGLLRMAELWSEFLGEWDDYRAALEALREMEDGRVLALVRGRGRGRTSGAAFDDRSANIFEIRGRKVVRLAIYNERGRALADLGLAE